MVKLVIDGPRVGRYLFTLAGVSSPVYLIYSFTSVTLSQNHYICICRTYSTLYQFIDGLTPVLCAIHYCYILFYVEI